MENALREQKIKVIIYQQLSHTTLKEWHKKVQRIQPLIFVCKISDIFLFEKIYFMVFYILCLFIFHTKINVRDAFGIRSG